MDREKTIRALTEALGIQFDMYSWEDIIGDLDLTDEEKKWAKENTWPEVKVEE